MRLTIPACAILLAACASGGPGLAHEAPIRVSLSELRLDIVAGRAALRERVAHTARAYCTAQGAAFAPYEARWDPFTAPICSGRGLSAGCRPTSARPMRWHGARQGFADGGSSRRCCRQARR
ncbi:UrcA family protein [Sphingomonas sp. 7/4-4]|uniref:UrcA family protein n=1 Tax=Sphingomonas sp. 7/4-4 TaxID=3018446 RepID=UPI003FA7CD07